MILRDQVSFRTSTPVLIGAGLLAILALPRWSASATPIWDQDKAAQSDASPAASAGAPVSSNDDQGDARPSTSADTAPSDRAGQSSVPRRPGRRSSDAAASPREDDRADTRPAQGQRARNSSDASPADRRTQLLRQLRRRDRASIEPMIPPSDVQKADVRPADAREDSAGADVRPADGTTRREASRDVRDGRIDRQRERQFEYDVRTDTLTSDPLVRRDRRKDAAPESRGREQRTRSRRIKEMRALIDQLQDELQALENEDQAGEDQ
jgi:hypothetical protein